MTKKSNMEENKPMLIWHKPAVQKLVISLDTTSNNSLPVAGLALDFEADG